MPPIPEEQPLTSNELLSGFKAGYDAAYLTGWEQGYNMGKIHTLQMQHGKQYQWYQTNRRGAYPDRSEEDEPDDCYDGDNKRQTETKATGLCFLIGGSSNTTWGTR